MAVWVTVLCAATVAGPAGGTTVTRVLPLTPPTVAVIVAGPGETPVTRPLVGLTVAKAGALDTHASGRPVTTLLLISSTVVPSCTVWLTWTVGFAGDSVTEPIAGVADQLKLPLSVRLVGVSADTMTLPLPLPGLTSQA